MAAGWCRHRVRRRKWRRRQRRSMDSVAVAAIVAPDRRSDTGTAPASPPARRKWTPALRWIDDADVSVCMCCRRTEFNVFNWKHHCRHCGRVVCNACSKSKTWHPALHRAARTCLDCVGGSPAVETFVVPVAGADADIADHGNQTIVEAFECERYEGTSWSASHLRPADGEAWKSATMLRHFPSLADFEAGLPAGSMWISSKWFLESGQWEYAVHFPESATDPVEWSPTPAGPHQVRRRKWIRRLWYP